MGIKLLGGIDDVIVLIGLPGELASTRGLPELPQRWLDVFLVDLLGLVQGLFGLDLHFRRDQPREIICSEGLPVIIVLIIHTILQHLLLFVELLAGLVGSPGISGCILLIGVHRERGVLVGAGAG